MLKFKKGNNTLDIEYTIGDTLIFNILSENGFPEGAELRLQVSPSGNDNDIIIEKVFDLSEDGVFEITIEASKIATLNAGRSYQYRFTFFDIEGHITTTTSGNLIVKWGA